MASSGFTRRPKEVDERIKARTRLIKKAQGGDKKAQETLAAPPYRIRVYTNEELREFEIQEATAS
jgi:hypothetical protein